jgi:DNA-binding transcriptional regulator GbsR (MarR family)
MKKLILTLLAAVFSLQLFSAPVLAKIDPDLKQQIKALKDLKRHTKDKDLKAQLQDLIKQLKASSHV